MALTPLVAPNLAEDELAWVADYLARTRIIVIDGDDEALVNKGHESWLPERKRRSPG